MKFRVIAVIVTVCFISLCSAQTIVIPANDQQHIHYMGRIDVQPTEAMLSWPGNSISFSFEGTGAKVLLKDQYGQNRFNIIVDGRVIERIQIDTGKRLYTLVENLPRRRHTLELFKITEWDKGKTWFYQIELNKDAKVLPARITKKRKIEYFGDSITCGYAVEDSSGKDRGTATYENNYISYAAITARHFDAEYHCTAKSGIGITVSYGSIIMPEMYNRLDATDSQSRWNFARYTPDVVVINLFQNDAGLTTQPNHEQFKARFGTKQPAPAAIIKAYQDFLKTIRVTYPKAQIICTLGSMSASSEKLPWASYIKQAVRNSNDKKISTLIFPVKNTPGHPNIEEQQSMANQLIAFIDKTVKW